MAATKRPAGVRFAAGGAAVALIFGLPLLIVLSAVAGERWQSLINTLLIVFILGPVVFWFLFRRRPASEAPGEPPAD